jgi:hypothetical protein
MIAPANRTKFLKQKDLKEKSVTNNRDMKPEERSRNIELVWKYRRLWDAMSAFRQRRKRNKEYFHGNQWGDVIVGKDGKGITEAQNIINQGKIPLKNNMISSTVTSILGVFRQSYGKPEVIARNLDNQRLGEMLTCMAEYIYQVERTKELDAKDLLEFIISGFCAQTVDYQWDDEKGRNEEVFVSHNPSRMFLNMGIEDPRGSDISTIGVLMDMTIDEACQRFAHNKADANKIRNIYKLCTKTYLENTYRQFAEPKDRFLDFFVPYDQKLCRVIQAWEKEVEESYLVHDKMEGKWYEFPVSEKAQIDEMIRQRELDIEYEGLDYESCKIDEPEYHTATYWKVRYLSPFGDILYEARSPFAHNSHPFVVCMGHLIDGEIHSFVENIIDQQRYINRLITMIDFIMGASAKGVLVFPENAIPKGMSKEEILEEWTSYNGVIFANLKPGVPVPQQISTNATNIGASEMLYLQMQMIRDVSGVHGALQGKEPKSNTASSLYAQEAQNSQINVLDLLESFTEFRTARDYKAMKIAPQCYDEPFFINLSGREYEKEAHWWNPEEAAKTDIYVNLSENNNSAVYRMQLNQIMIKAMEMGLVDFETVLQSGVVPNGDRMLTIIERRKQQLQKEQAAMQAAQMQGQAQGQAMAEAGASQAEIMQAGADAAIAGLEGAENADPRAVELINQALA